MAQNELLFMEHLTSKGQKVTEKNFPDMQMRTDLADGADSF